MVYVVANLRGGGEYGEPWHRAGNLKKKQNVFDDFAAAARWLIDNHYTTAAKLAIEGGSNGGLLMGAAETQHPELYRAVVSHVGIYDMLRVELQPNGAFNVTEFGTVKEMDQFRSLYDYSPYHHVKDGTRIPGHALPHRRERPPSGPVAFAQDDGENAGQRDQTAGSPAHHQQRRPRHRHCAHRANRPADRRYGVPVRAVGTAVVRLRDSL